MCFIYSHSSSSVKLIILLSPSSRCDKEVLYILQAFAQENIKTFRSFCSAHMYVDISLCASTRYKWKKSDRDNFHLSIFTFHTRFRRRHPSTLFSYSTRSFSGGIFKRVVQQMSPLTSPLILLGQLLISCHVNFKCTYRRGSAFLTLNAN